MHHPWILQWISGDLPALALHRGHLSTPSSFLALCFPLFRPRIFDQIDRINGVAPGASPTGAAFLSFRTVLRTAVLSCIGKGLRGPYLEKAGGAGEDLRLYPGDSKNSDSPAFDGHTGAAMERGGGSASGRRFTEAVGPLVATQTVLLVKGKDFRIRRNGLDMYLHVVPLPSDQVHPDCWATLRACRRKRQI